MDPGSMYSRGIYDRGALERVLSGTDDEIHNKATLVLKIATLEGLCRELDVRPEPSFWSGR
jgi:hypothetical protein